MNRRPPWLDDGGRRPRYGQRFVIALIAILAGVALALWLADRGDGSGAPTATLAAGLSVDGAPGGYWVGEFRRRWLAERRDGRARAGTVRALRTLLHIQAMRRTEIAGVWVALARCESGARWEYNGSSGFDGGLQFHPSTWAQYAPADYPGFAWLASPEQQVAVARLVLVEQGWAAWPACSRALGLR